MIHHSSSLCFWLSGIGFCFYTASRIFIAVNRYHHGSISVAWQLVLNILPNYDYTRSSRSQSDLQITFSSAGSFCFARKKVIKKR